MSSEHGNLNRPQNSPLAHPTAPQTSKFLVF
jgi:hypothetical protein